jgi:hypothetical protein
MILPIQKQRLIKIISPKKIHYYHGSYYSKPQTAITKKK